MYIYFYTLGCKVNQYETALMQQMFTDKGYILTDDSRTADICIINSCTVTAESNSKTRQILHRLRTQNENAVIAVTGCYPQAEKNINEALPEADIITGTKDRAAVVRLIENYLTDRQRTIYIPELEKHEEYENITARTIPGHTRGFIKIQDGCNQYCSYCLIPYARGPVRSKPVQSVLDEVRTLAENGYHEIVFTGINLAFYGADLGSDLAEITQLCADINGIERIRLSSLEPERMTDDMIERLVSVKELCPSFHLSLQSGCNKTLKAMGRRYTAEDYAKIVEKLRSHYPLCSITTDVITGFPGETDEDFAESLEFIKKTGFASVHVFPYSERKGTKAEAMPNKVDMNIRRQRAAILKDAVSDLHRNFLEKHIGMKMPVLFEHEKNDGFHRGYTPDSVLIKCSYNNDEKSLQNQIKYVIIEKADFDCCIGKLVK